MDKDQETQHRQQDFKPNKYHILLVGYLYFIQGVLLSIPGTMILVYANLPSYQTLSLFAMVNSPFSFKFLIAPLIEKYSSIKYGKRKTWIIISQSMASIIIFMISFLTDQQYQLHMVVMLFFAVFCICLQDISLDAMSIKQLKIPHLTAMLQSTMQTMGVMFGGLVLLKFTSLQFGTSIGLQEAITSPSIIFKFLSLLIIVPTIVIHFAYNESFLESQLIFSRQSLLQIIKCYRVFLYPSTKFFRQIIFFIVYYQGFNLYNAGYSFQLINSGFSKNTFNTISHCVLIPITLITIFTSSKIQQFGIIYSWRILMIAQWIINLMVWNFFPLGVQILSVLGLVNGLLGSFGFIVSSIVINSFPVSGLSGMFITMLASGSNLGKNVALHLQITGLFGWRTTAAVGLFIQFFIILSLRRLYQYVQNGKTYILVTQKQEQLKKQE